MPKKTNEYFKWLCGLVKEPDRISQGVLKPFFETEFYEIIPNDINRAEDGLYLRNEFRSPDGTYPLGMTPCSVLEMMVGLSRHMGEMASAVGELERPSYWFWMMMDNLGLTEYVMLPFLEDDVEVVQDIVNAMVDRDYRNNGVGGLFPLRNPPGNQVTTELWYQMQHWLEENI